MKPDRCPVSRRRFLEKSARGVAGLSLAGAASRSTPAMGYVNRTEVHPNVPNTRVVAAHNEALTEGTGPVSSWWTQNDQTDEAVVYETMDQMARALTEQVDAAEAWKRIFLKPEGKKWEDVVVAVKTNNIATHRTRNQVLKKFCEVLVDGLGVTGSNIHVYDGVHGRGMAAFYGLPEGVKLEQTWGGTTYSVTLPAPAEVYTTCVQSIGDGSADIILNVALCKGHSTWNGNVTLAMKNHYGTFRPNIGHYTDYLIAVNKCQTLLGRMDAGSGEIAHPRQQLCFIDALWASEGGPEGGPSARPNRFFMGTFAPTLDYLVSKRFRKGTMGWSIQDSVIDRFLSDFGYTTNDLPDGGQMIDAMTWEPTALERTGAGGWRDYR